jgi:tRNA synthetase class II core domain (G, H, P, S and T)
VQSFRDLPLKIHQTCNVFRYETKQTRPLIRAREIHWNEVRAVADTLLLVTLCVVSSLIIIIIIIIIISSSSSSSSSSSPCSVALLCHLSLFYLFYIFFCSHGFFCSLF